MKDAEKADVPVVSEDYLNAVKGGGALLMISQHSIASWGNKVSYKTENIIRRGNQYKQLNIFLRLSHDSCC